MMIRVTAAALVAVLTVPMGSYAKQMTQMHVGNWAGGAYSNDATGAFSHCAVSASYESGITMFISMGRNFEWALGFADTGWVLHVGDNYRLIYEIDNSGWRDAQATVISPIAVKVPMPANSELVRLFRRGLRMDLTAAGQNFSFNLTGTSAAVAALADCVSGQLTLESNTHQPKNPFVAGPAVANPPVANVDAEEATRVTTNFLLAANLPGARILARDEVPKSLSNHGAVWSWRDGLGVTDIASGTPENDIAQLIAQDAASCKSKFASGSSPPEDQQGAIVYQAFTICGDARQVLVQYFIVQRPAGGVYAFGIGTTSVAANTNKATEGGMDLPSVKRAVFSATR